LAAISRKFTGFFGTYKPNLSQKSKKKFCKNRASCVLTELKKEGRPYLGMKTLFTLHFPLYT
jgi:hypothetical protein